ncbi:MAG: phosphatase PAP2 family protein [Desulfuromonadales bacterium]|nr:phosphatase PAP2 family protein [Desulfuromonadales bacterium]
MKPVTVVRLSVMIFCLSLLCGCGTLPNGRGWGEDATMLPGWDKMGTAAYNAVLSPFTWGPIAGAALLQIDNWDHKISRWATDKTPVFGSRDNANNWSNYLLYTSGAIYGTTVLLTPSGNQAAEWLTDKMKGFVVGGAAIGLSEGIVGILQPALGRERPDRSPQSFPSGHATAAASFSTLASKNIAAMNLPGSAELAADGGLILITASTAWARVEAKRHFPADILAGMAIGHFISSFVNDAFLGLDNSRGIVPDAEISKNGFILSVKGNY